MCYSQATGAQASFDGSRFNGGNPVYLNDPAGPNGAWTQGLAQDPRAAKSLLDAMPTPEPDKLAKPVYADMARTGAGGGPRSLLGAA